MLTIEYWTHNNNLAKKTTNLSNLQCTIQNYPNRVISALGDNLFFCVQFCKHKAKIMLLKAKELSHEKKFSYLLTGFANARFFCKFIPFYFNQATNRLLLAASEKYRDSGTVKLEKDIPRHHGWMHTYMNSVILTKWCIAVSTKYWHRSARESLKNSSSAKITISSECNTRWFMLVFRIWIVVIASAVIMLAWLQKERKKERSQKIDDLPILLNNLPVWYFSNALWRS